MSLQKRRKIKIYSRSSLIFYIVYLIINKFKIINNCNKFEKTSILSLKNIRNINEIIYSINQNKCGKKRYDQNEHNFVPN